MMHGGGGGGGGEGDGEGEEVEKCLTVCVCVETFLCLVFFGKYWKLVNRVRCPPQLLHIFKYYIIP